MKAAPDPATINRLYGRSKGKPLRAAQAALIETLLPQIAVPSDGPVTAERLFGDPPAGTANQGSRADLSAGKASEGARADPSAGKASEGARQLHFEIGFGGGEHMAARADMLPDHGFIGCEPFLNGVAQALTHIAPTPDRPGLTNVRIHHGDALDVLRRIPDGALSFVYLLHPDPWPKARHAKRRMMNDGPLALIAAKLKPGGEFRFGTDHPVYVAHAMMVMRRYTRGPDAPFTWLANDADAMLKRPGGWPETRYEAKARRLGHEVWYFRYRRTSGCL